MPEKGISASPPRWRRVGSAVWRLLTEPSPLIFEQVRRQQARLLMAMLVILSGAGLLALILSLLGAFASPGQPERVSAGYLWITLGAVFLLTIQYGVSRTIYYRAAAMLAVGTVLGATFMTAAFDPLNRQFFPFLVLGGLVASLFFSAAATALVFMGTFLGLLFLPLLVPAVSAADNANALFFIATVGALVVMATTLRQRYLEQIDSQTRQLVNSEARLRELAIQDSLTGLFNRRYLEDVLALEMKRAARAHSPIGVILADIDHFKRFNDTHGHAAGDAVLLSVAKLLRAHVRASDIICRYGGEEFVLVLPEATQAITEMRAWQICEDARQLHTQFEGDVLEPVTLSLGIATFPEQGSTPDRLLAVADHAMYQAKSGGRDRVARADDL